MEVNSYLRRSADAGYPIAKKAYGNRLLLGNKGLKRDVSRGIKLLEEAAHLGDGNAAALLTFYYAAGKDILRDLNKARRFLALAQREGVEQRVLTSLRKRIAKEQAAERRTGSATPPRPVVSRDSKPGASTKSSRPTLVDLRKYGPRAPKASARVQADFKNRLREAVR